MNVEIGTETAQFLFWEYINRNSFAAWVKIVLCRPLRRYILYLYFCKVTLGLLEVFKNSGSDGL
jgi:hypothetical protein